MALLARRTLVIRGHDTTDDPEAVGYAEASLEVTKATPVRAPLGEERRYVGGVIRAPRGRRWEIECEAWGLTTEAGTTASDLQDYGEYLAFDAVLQKRYVYLYRYWQNGNDHTTGAAKRAASHSSATNGADEFWYSTTATSDTYPSSATGHLPMAIECPGGLKPQLSSAGINELTFTLVGRYPIS